MADKNFMPWSETHEISKVYKIKKRRGWLQVQIGLNKETNLYELRLRKPRVNFTVPSQKYLNEVITLLSASSKYIGWQTYAGSSEKEEESVISVSSPEVDKQISKKQEKLKLELEKARTMQQHAIELIRRYAPKQWEADIKEFKELISSNDKISEKQIQNWIFEHTWILGSYYIDATKEEKTRDNDRIDFIIQRIDMFYDIIELKLPGCKILENEELFTGNVLLSPSREYPISKDVTDSVSQVMKYLEELENDKHVKYTEEGILIHHPIAKVIIGRSSKVNRAALRAINIKLNGIEILTYDDVIVAGENLIKLFKNARKEKKQVK